MSNYWLFVTDEENWKTCLQNETWGTHDGHMKKFQRMELNDVIIVYVKVLKLAGTCVVTQTYYYSDEPLWPNELYPHRIGFKPKNLLDKPKNIREYFYENFSRSPTGFFRTSIRKLPEEEAELLLKAINEEGKKIVPSLYSFRLNEEDFKACRRSTSENFIGSVRDKFRHELQPQLLSALGDRFTVFKKKGGHSSPYVARSHTRRDGGYYRDHMWLGMAHNKYDDPRHGVQFQFGIRRDSIFSYGIWLEGRSYARTTRGLVVDILSENKIQFISLIRRLSDKYKINLLDSDIEINPSEITEEDVKVILNGIIQGEFFNIKRELTPEEAINLGTSIVKHIADTFSELLPIYNYLADIKTEELGHYFIFRTGSGEYEDKPSSTYHFREGIPAYKQVLNAEKMGEFVYYELDKGGFWAKGKINNISSEEREGVTHYFIHVREYEEIGHISFDSIKDQLSFDIVGQAGMRKISKDDYNVITGTFPERERVTLEGQLEILSAAHLLSGKNLVIYGPPGTGKTRLAKRLAQIFCGDRYSLVTANAEWSAINVVGGEYISSKENDVGLGTEFRKGFLANAASEGKKNLYWLIIDELNRANLDLAFGEAFTLLDIEHREHTPLIRSDDSIVKEALFLPCSFRLLATINSYDRAALFSLGYAFRRRFAFLELASPYLTIIKDEPINIEEINWQTLIEEKNPVLESVRIEISNWIKPQEDPPLLDPDRRITNLDSYSLKLSGETTFLATGPLNVYHLFHYLSEWITQQEIVSMGYSQTVDAIKFVHVYICLVEINSANICKAADFAFLAYYLPHLEYFLPKVRREKISRTTSELVELPKLERLGDHLRELGLLKSAQKIMEIRNRMEKFGEISVF